jgi:hypothetical protein
MDPHPTQRLESAAFGLKEGKLELWVGAEVSERDVGDDQPASLIGMIR